MMLIRNLFILSAILITLGSCSKKSEAKELPPALVSFAIDDSTLRSVIAVNQWDTHLRIDTLTKEDGKWEYRTMVDTTELITFFIDGGSRDISLMVSPKSRIEISGSFDSLQYRGDSINRVWLDYQKEIEPLRQEIDSMRGLYTVYSKVDSSTFNINVFGSREYKRVDSLWKNSVNSFVMDHRDNPLSLLAIEGYYTATANSDSIAQWMKRLSPRTRGYGVEKSLSRIATLRGNSRIGGRMPFLRFVDSKGETLNSNSFTRDGLLVVFLYSNEDAFVKAVKSDIGKLQNKKKGKKEPNIWVVGLNENEESIKRRLDADSLASEILYSRSGVNDPLLQQSGIVSLPTLIVLNEKHDLVGYNCYGGELRRIIEENRVK
ncbi:MAG: hypothetical protein ACRC6R_05970 [Bacteroidales bacterium]